MHKAQGTAMMGIGKREEFEIGVDGKDSQSATRLAWTPTANKRRASLVRLVCRVTKVGLCSHRTNQSTTQAPRYIHRHFSTATPCPAIPLVRGCTGLLLFMRDLILALAQKYQNQTVPSGYGAWCLCLITVDLFDSLV